MQLRNKVGIITGGARGIGKGIAEAFIREGATVIIADKNELNGAEVSRNLNLIQANCAEFINTDVTSSQSVLELIDSVIKKYGRIDILVNNAGYHISKSVENTSEEEWDFIINTNLKSTFLLSKHCIPHLKISHGSIIIISSMVGLVGQSNAGAYAASKAGQLGLTKNMAIDLAKDQIRVNAICPGWINTPLVEDWFNQQPDPEEAKKQVYSIHPLNRIGTVEEVGKAAVFLAGEDSTFITGTEIKIEGAVTLGY